MTGRLVAVWAALAVVLAGLLAVFSGLAVNAVPKSWGWAHNWWLLVGVSVGLVVMGVVVAVLQSRKSPENQGGSPSIGRDGTGPTITTTEPYGSPIAGSNAGMMISAQTVYMGPPPEVPGQSRESPSPLFPVGENKEKGSENGSAAPIKEGLVMRARWTTINGESMNIDFHDIGLAELWIRNPWGRPEAPGAKNEG